jgi:hypothetical protein
MNSRLTLGSLTILPSVLKKLLPATSSKTKVSPSAQRTKPGAPPRWEMSTPPPDEGSSSALREAMKKVAAVSTKVRGSSAVVAIATTGSGRRLWM